MTVARQYTDQDLDRIADQTHSVLRPPRSKELPLTFFDDAGEFPQKDWLIKGVVARRETSSWIAAPGKGKSALLTDIALHVGSGRDWRGYRTKGKHAVVYFAFERADLVRRRLAAHARRDGFKGLPIAVAEQLVNLLDPSNVQVIVDTIRAAENATGSQVGLIIIDTFSKGIAAGGGDEDKAKDQNAVLANLRRVQQRTDAHVALIGHTGKDETRGARGSNAHLGDVDLMVQIRGDLTKTAEVIKGNDQPEGVLTSFDLEVFELGLDEDGDPITTAVISPNVPATAERPPAVRKRLTDRQINALEALTEATLNVGAPAPAAFGLPAGIKVVETATWRDEILRRGIIDTEVKNSRGAFHDLKNALASRKVIGVRDDLVWRA